MMLMLSSPLSSALLAVLGLGLLVSGLVMPEKLRRPWGDVSAFLAPAGLALTILGVLSLCVPGFFAG